MPRITKSLGTRSTGRWVARATWSSFAAICVCGIATGTHGPCDSGSKRQEPVDPVERIADVLRVQVEAWNAGDIDRFMSTYWRSDALTFSSGGETTRGWTATRDRYRRRYPDRTAMGQLQFSELEVESLGEGSAFVLGRWKLTRERESMEGNFTLILRQLDDEWRIVHDHSSLQPPDDESENPSP